MHTKKPAPAIKWLLEKKLLEGKILDYGAGFGRNTEFLLKKGVDVCAFDPYNAGGIVKDQFPAYEFDTVFSSFVLNVVTKEEQEKIMEDCRKAINGWGTVFHIVRNKDVTELGKKHGKTEEEILEGFTTSRGFQRLVSLDLECIYSSNGYKIYMEEVGAIIYHKEGE